MKVKSKKIKNERGMTLFIAVTIMGILLFISFAVVNIAVKSSIFTTSGRDSQFAFYAADAGVDCAIYWDSRFEPSKFDPATSGSPISCAGYSLTSGSAIAGTTTATTLIGGGGANTTSVFGFKMDKGLNPVEACAIVTVTKTGLTTYIKSRGYNTCDTNNPRRIERGVEVTY